MIQFRVARVIAGTVLVTVIGSSNTPVEVQAQPKPSTARSTRKKTTTARSTSAAARASVPAQLVGTWVWGMGNPGRYVNPTTGDYVGHAGGGAVSHTFSADGTYKRYVLIHFGAGFSNQSIFSAMEGKAKFDEATGTLRIQMSRGQITFEKKKGMEKRPLSREDMERGGTVFSYSLSQDENGKTSLMLNDKGKPASEGRAFYKEVEAQK